MVGALRLQDFRCFEALSLELPERGAIFVGENAQGKTSILEAVCVLVRMHSPRAKTMRAMVRFEQVEFGVAGECWGEERQVRNGRGAVRMLVEGEEMKTQGDFLREGGLVVWMGNEDVALVRGSGGGRRHYLDFVCSQLDGGYRRALSRYRRVLKARNLLLKDRIVRDEEVRAYGELLIEHGDYLTRVRGEILELLEPFAIEAQKVISGRDEVLGLVYESGSGGDMRVALETSYESERRQRQTVVGPHRDDVKILLNGMPAGDFASEGQQRTIALALKLAQGKALRERGGRDPVYLLDDIFGELDASRRNALMGFLPDGAQKLITTTSLDWLVGEFEGWARFGVVEGAVEERD